MRSDGHFCRFWEVLAIPLNLEEIDTVPPSVWDASGPASHAGRISWSKVPLWEMEALAEMHRCDWLRRWERLKAHVPDVGISSRRQERYQQLMWGPYGVESKAGKQDLDFYLGWCISRVSDLGPWQEYGLNITSSSIKHWHSQDYLFSAEVLTQLLGLLHICLACREIVYA